MSTNGDYYLAICADQGFGAIYNRRLLRWCEVESERYTQMEQYSTPVGMHCAQKAEGYMYG